MCSSDAMWIFSKITRRIIFKLVPGVWVAILSNRVISPSIARTQWASLASNYILVCFVFFNFIMASSWQLLPLYFDSLKETPLLSRSSFQTQSYDIFVTDLTSVWSESLDRRQIIRRALNEDTSIDPSQDSTQLKILLDKIKAGLLFGWNEGQVTWTCQGA